MSTPRVRNTNAGSARAPMFDTLIEAAEQELNPRTPHRVVHLCSMCSYSTRALDEFTAHFNRAHAPPPARKKVDSVAALEALIDERVSAVETTMKGTRAALIRCGSSYPALKKDLDAQLMSLQANALREHQRRSIFLEVKPRLLVLEASCLATQERARTIYAHIFEASALKTPVKAILDAADVDKARDLLAHRRRYEGEIQDYTAVFLTLRADILAQRAALQVALKPLFL